MSWAQTKQVEGFTYDEVTSHFFRLLESGIECHKILLVFEGLLNLHRAQAKMPGYWNV